MDNLNNKLKSQRKKKTLSVQSNQDHSAQTAIYYTFFSHNVSKNQHNNKLD